MKKLKLWWLKFKYRKVIRQSDFEDKFMKEWKRQQGIINLLLGKIIKAYPNVNPQITKEILIELLQK